MTDTFTIEDSVVPLRPAMLAGIEREWTRLGRPGTWWTASERVDIAAVARAAIDDAPAPDHGLDEAVASMAQRVATDAHHIERTDVDALDAAGVSPTAYTELVGVVARLAAVDTTVAGVGGRPLTFPDPAAGEPTRLEVAGAKRRSAHVPMVGAAGAITALTAVSDEEAAQADLHGALYLRYDEMGNPAIVKDIPRWQMELAATTTSWLNHCVY